jgi:hypothetical protein
MRARSAGDPSDPDEESARGENASFLMVFLLNVPLPLQEYSVQCTTVTRIVWHWMDKDISDPGIEYSSRDVSLLKNKNG